MGNRHRKRRKERHRGRRDGARAWDAVEHADLPRAEEIIRKALRGHEGDPVLWNDLGLILWRREKLRDAEKAFRNAILVQPQYEDARMNLSILLASRGFFRQALRIEEELAASSTSRRAYHEQKVEEYRLAVSEMEAGQERRPTSDLLPEGPEPDGVDRL